VVDAEAAVIVEKEGKTDRFVAACRENEQISRLDSIRAVDNRTKIGSVPACSTVSRVR
jgi:hypothetical protein